MRFHLPASAAVIAVMCLAGTTGAQQPQQAQQAKTDLSLRVAVAPFAIPDAKSGKLTSTVAIVLGVREPPPPERMTERLDVQVRAFTQRGEARGMTTQQAVVTLPAA